MRSIIKRAIINFLPKSVKQEIISPYLEGQKSYAQEGEDIILNRLFKEKRDGFFVDVGAYHPVIFSNTYFFYKKGWRGINIEPRPGSADLFEKYRPEDVNLELAIGNSSEELTYYLFKEPAYNTCSASQAEIWSRSSEIIGKQSIHTWRLSEVLDKYLDNNSIIDFLSVDVEGLDYQVLLSNDWERYRPTVILVESINSDLKGVLNSSICRYMDNHGYELFSKIYNTSVFKLR